MTDDMLTIHEAAALAGVAPNSIYRARRRGCFPNAVNVGGTHARRAEWRIPRDEVLAYKASKWGAKSNEEDI